NGVPIDLGGPEYTKEDIHVIECIKNHTLPLVNIFEATKTQSVIETMYEAAKKKENMKVKNNG
ncbi:MAG: hypothetical protein KGL95_12380, partial [Patescibacteria group bacterium]|nr:hypothetical protein [Patescibacteria group bacterium]